MNRTIVAYGVALVLAYGAAYVTWKQPAESVRSDSVVILPGKVEELEGITFTSERLELELDQQEDALGRYAWVRATPKVPEKTEEAAEEAAPDLADPADPHGHDAPAKAKPEPEEPSEFKAGKTVDAILEGLAPFVAKRALDQVDDAQLEELGLAPNPSKLVLRRKGKPAKTFLLGDAVYGGAHYYVQDPETSKVYVVDASLLRPLFTGNVSLPETMLFAAEAQEIRRFEVQSGAAKAVFEQHNPDDPQARFWTRDGQDDADAAAAAWIDKALRLRSAAYVPQGRQPAALDEAFSFTVHARRSVRVTVFRSFDDDGEEQWFAESEYTRGLVRLHPSMAAEAMADLPSVLEEQGA